MKLSQLILATAIAFSACYAFADEFDHDGIRINFPRSFAEKKVMQLEGETIYLLTQQYDATSPQKVIGVFVHVRDISNGSETQNRIATKGTAYESEIALATAVRNVFGFPGFKILKDIRHLDISGHKATTATVSYLGSYAGTEWSAGPVNVTIYCITESARSIEFQVIALSDAPKDLVSSTIETIENITLETP
ncbi:MAG: hypothetical protein LBE81_07480 [Azonexus sp.]|jgi:hypothetical protein|uniref:hypothetical protein n=1 Tax=Azonexus sp. TaxID=1872668 RepID=UPI0028334F57|nr:hypothetical protein [Azonexus sp.]MDR0776463.1 hypothetical protein [Azonexus sp.]